MNIFDIIMLLSLHRNDFNEGIEPWTFRFISRHLKPLNHPAPQEEERKKEREKERKKERKRRRRPRRRSEGGRGMKKIG